MITYNGRTYNLDKIIDIDVVWSNLTIELTLKHRFNQKQKRYLRFKNKVEMQNMLDKIK
ncbi:MAG: hypothetical protein ACK5Z5_07525 [Neisseriaceae bacterium]|jgi:hypothetical protein